MLRPWLRYAAVSALYKLTGADVIALRDEIARLRYQLDETMVELLRLKQELAESKILQLNYQTKRYVS